MTDPDGVIEHISSSAINFLKIDLKFVNGKNKSIEDLVPDILRNKDKFQTK
jgi:hypothetical protein